MLIQCGPDKALVRRPSLLQGPRQARWSVSITPGPSSPMTPPHSFPPTLQRVLEGERSQCSGWSSIFVPALPVRGGLTVVYPSHSQFLENLDANPWFNAPHLTSPDGGLLPTSALQQAQDTGSGTGDISASPLFGFNPDTPRSQATPKPSAVGPSASPEISTNQTPQHHELEHVDPLPPSTKTERFLLTAADQETGTRDERLKAVIHAKYEAALLKPYNYVKGYARLSRWMERK